MALEQKDLQAIRLLMREEIRTEIEPFREEVRNNREKEANRRYFNPCNRSLHTHVQCAVEPSRQASRGEQHE